MTYFQDCAAASRVQTACLRVLIDRAEKDPELAQALGRLDASRLASTAEALSLAVEDLRNELRDEETETARWDRRAEMQRRAAEAGARNRGGLCACGCSGLAHGELTDDERMPCTTAGCACADLEYAPA